MLNHLLQIIFSLLPDTRLYKLKRCILRFRGFKVGDNVRVVSTAKFKLKHMEIGNNTFIGHNVFISGGLSSKVTIGSNCDLAPSVTILAGTHSIGTAEHRAGKGISTNIHIGNGTWVGGNSTILPGVTIGRGTIVGAGSVVLRDTPKNTLVAGNPAAVKKQLN